MSRKLLIALAATTMIVGAGDAGASQLRCASADLQQVRLVAGEATHRLQRRMGGLIAAAVDAGCDPAATEVWQGRYCERFIGQIVETRDRIAAANGDLVAARGYDAEGRDCGNAMVVSLDQPNPALAAHVLRVAPENADPTGTIAIPTDRPDPARMRVSSAGSPEREPAVEKPVAAAVPRIDLTIPREISEERKNVRVVGARFLPDVDDRIDFRDVAAAAQPPLNEAFGTILSFVGATGEAVAEGRGDASAPGTETAGNDAPVGERQPLLAAAD